MTLPPRNPPKSLRNSDPSRLDFLWLQTADYRFPSLPDRAECWFLPKITAPACLRRCTILASFCALWSVRSGSPQVVGWPCQSKLSFTVTGTPWRGPMGEGRAIAGICRRQRCQTILIDNRIDLTVQSVDSVKTGFERQSGSCRSLIQCATQCASIGIDTGMFQMPNAYVHVYLASRTFDRNCFSRSFCGFPNKSSGLPSSTIRPPSKKQTRSDTSRAKPIWWVTSRIV